MGVDKGVGASLGIRVGVSGANVSVGSVLGIGTGVAPEPHAIQQIAANGIIIPSGLRTGLKNGILAMISLAS